MSRINWDGIVPAIMTFMDRFTGWVKEAKEGHTEKIYGNMCSTNMATKLKSTLIAKKSTLANNRVNASCKRTPDK